MTAPSPSPSKPAAPTTPAPEQQRREATLLNQILDREVEYVPFMAKEAIRLTPRMVLRFLCTPTKSGAVCDERQATRFVMMCKSRGLNPWEGDAFLVGYDSKDGPQFSLITAHQAFLKRAEVHPEYDGMESGVIVRRETVDPANGALGWETLDLVGDYHEDGDTLLGGWATIHFKGRKYPMRKRVRLSTFNRGFGRWRDDPAGMIVKVSEADALRSAFPNSLGGLYLEGEMPTGDAPGARPTPPAPPAGRQSLRNGNGHGSSAASPAAPPVAFDPTADEARAADSARELADELASRIELAETRKALEVIGTDALRWRDQLGEQNYREFINSYRARFAALAETIPAGREPGEEE